MKAETEGSSRFALIFLGAGTILLALASVLISWHNLTLISKVTAIIFLAVLIISPFREISSSQRGRDPIGPHGGLIVGYLITILALASLVRH